MSQETTLKEIRMHFFDKFQAFSYFLNTILIFYFIFFNSMSIPDACCKEL